MELNDFRTRHRSDAAFNMTISWTGIGCSGKYDTWVTKGFTLELNEKQEELVDGWIKSHASEATRWVWSLMEIK
jgi:hypothetical protein